jgi:hypothetical protein
MLTCNQEYQHCINDVLKGDLEPGPRETDPTRRTTRRDGSLFDF